MIDLVVVGAGAALTALGIWFFFGPRASQLAELRDGVQVARYLSASNAPRT